MAWHFQWRQLPSVPLEVEGITPDRFATQSANDLLRATVYHGNRSCELGEFLQVTAGDDPWTWHFEGDFRPLHWLGAKLSAGSIHVHGHIGRHVGSEMTGGRIDVYGDASDWLGAEMHGGQIHVRGNAGHLVGAAYRGSPLGMTGGLILVDGNAGNEVAMSQRRGLIAIRGSCGDLLGINLRAGTTVVLGETGIRCGAGMRRGTMILTHETRPELLPTFRRAGQGCPLILRLIFRELRAAGFTIQRQLDDSTFLMYHGDLLEGGRGEIFVAEP